jgi:hypothetical protein
MGKKKKNNVYNFRAPADVHEVLQNSDNASKLIIAALRTYLANQDQASEQPENDEEASTKDSAKAIEADKVAKPENNSKPATIDPATAASIKEILKRLSSLEKTQKELQKKLTATTSSSS